MPTAVFAVDGIQLMWSDDQLARGDYPISGYYTVWTIQREHENGQSGSDNKTRLRDFIDELEREAE